MPVGGRRVTAVSNRTTTTVQRCGRGSRAAAWRQGLRGRCAGRRWGSWGCGEHNGSYWGASADSVDHAEDARLPLRLAGDKENDGIIPDEIRESDRAGTFAAAEPGKAPLVPVEEKDPLRAFVGLPPSPPHAWRGERQQPTGSVPRHLAGLEAEVERLRWSYFVGQSEGKIKVDSEWL